MKKVTLTRPASFLVMSLALAGLLLSQSKPAVAADTFDLTDVQGRYVSAETAFDTSSVHTSSTDASIVGPPIYFAATAVMIADGNGNVCGETDGFYSGISAPGVNLGPSLFHGTYTVEADTGRITIQTVSDGEPSETNTFCGTTTPIAEGEVTKTQVGYLQSKASEKVTTVEQVFGDPNLSSGFLSHSRVWTKSSASSQSDDNADSCPSGPPDWAPGPPDNPGPPDSVSQGPPDWAPGPPEHPGNH